jgi:hypothetical protein
MHNVPQPDDRPPLFALDSPEANALAEALVGEGGICIVVRPAGGGKYHFKTVSTGLQAKDERGPEHCFRAILQECVDTCRNVASNKADADLFLRKAFVYAMANKGHARMINHKTTIIDNPTRRHPDPGA